MSVFGIDPVILSDNDIDNELKKIQNCLLNENISINLNSDEPGLGALITTLIRTLEKTITTSFQPIIAIIRLVLEAIDTNNPLSYFINQVGNIANGIVELIQNPFNFIIEELLSPIIENINVPFPNAEGILEIITGQINIKDINWKKWLDDNKIIIPEKFKDRPKIIENILSLYEFNGSPSNGIMKLLEVLLLPFKMVISLLETILNLAKDFVLNVVKAIKGVIEILTNPVKFFIDLISEILGGIVGDIALSLVPFEVPNVNELINKVKEMVNALFTDSNFNFNNWFDSIPNELKLPLQPIIAFLKVFKCTILWFISLINPSNLLKILLPDGFSINDVKMPPIKTKEYNPAELYLLIDENINIEEYFDVGDVLIYNHNTRGELNFRVLSLNNNGPNGKEIRFAQDFSGGVEDTTNSTVQIQI